MQAKKKYMKPGILTKKKITRLRILQFQKAMSKLELKFDRVQKSFQTKEWYIVEIIVIIGKVMNSIINIEKKYIFPVIKRKSQ